MRKTRYILSLAVLAIVISLGLAACGGDDSGPDNATGEPSSTEIDLLLNYSPQPQDHAFWTAGMEQGFFEEEGIDLTLVEGTGSGDAVTAVGTGRYKLAQADTSTTILGVAEGVPVTAIATVQEGLPMAVIFKSEKGYKDLSDLKGAKIATSEGGSLSRTFPGVLKANGMTEDDVEIVYTAGTLSEQSAMLSGKADAFLGTFPADGVPLQLRDQDVTWMPFSDLGVNLLWLSIIANNDWLAENEEIARRFVSAASKSIEYTAENPEEAAKSFVAAYPDLFNEDSALAAIEANLELIKNEEAEDLPYGQAREDDWNATIDFLKANLDLDPDATIEDFVSFDYIGEGD